MTYANLSTEEAVIEWWLKPGPVSDARGPAAAIAKAMRLKEVWEQHRFKIKDMCEQRHQYRPVNSQTITRAVRAFCYAMDRAEEQPSVE